MAMLDLSSIPGYREAVNAENQARDSAYFDSPVPLRGIPINHLTLRRHMILTGCRNAFLVGGKLTHIDVMGLLWILAKDHSTEKGARELFVAEHIAHQDYELLVRDCVRYVDSVYIDSPVSHRPENPTERAYTTDITYIVDFLATEYGWTDDHILDMPVARIFQLLRQIQQRRNPKGIMFNRSCSIISRHLTQQVLGGGTPNG